jgi:CRISPR-associated protein Cas5t
MDADTLDLLRVEIAGEVTSFRYPHFTQGYQPTYEMPPPSTIYGMICAAVGRYLTDEEREALRFGYIFRHNGKFVDYMEHLHFDDPIQPFPFDRELLFRPRLMLYLTGLDLETAFRAPVYPIVLGRSQDLVGVQSVEWVTGQRVDQGYLEHTLLPMWMAPRIPKNVSVATMARYISPERQPEWASYALLRDVVDAYPPILNSDDEPDEFGEVDNERGEGLDGVWQFDGDEIELWAEDDGPTNPRSGLPRSFCLYSFVEEVT